jgi:hypothetical protein
MSEKSPLSDKWSGYAVTENLALRDPAWAVIFRYRHISGQFLPDLLWGHG